jgi:hypothetical protein
MCGSSEIMPLLLSCLCRKLKMKRLCGASSGHNPCVMCYCKIGCVLEGGALGRGFTLSRVVSVRGALPLLNGTIQYHTAPDERLVGV